MNHYLKPTLVTNEGVSETCTGWAYETREQNSGEARCGNSARRVIPFLCDGNVLNGMRTKEPVRMAHVHVIDVPRLDWIPNVSKEVYKGLPIGRTMDACTTIIALSPALLMLVEFLHSAVNDISTGIEVTTLSLCLCSIAESSA